MRIRYHILAAWFPIAIAGTILCALVYGAVQQDYRQNANDPQIQLVEDVVSDIAAGYPVFATLDNAPKVDMSKSLSSFMMVFDDSGKLIVSTASMGTSTPILPPSGVFDYVRKNGQDRITWQIPTGQRFAAVVGRFGSNDASASSTSGFVFSARSLREVELREQSLELMTVVAWVILLASTLLAVAYAEVVSKRQNVNM